MKWGAFLDRLSASLANGVWEVDAVTSKLSRRLPRRYRRYARAIAQEIVGQEAGSAPPASRTISHRLGHQRIVRRLWLYGLRNNVWPEVEVRSPRMAPLAAFARLDLPQLPTTASLADWLVVPPERLDYFADLQGRAEAHGETAINHYRYLVRPKRTGGVRLIEAPKSGLKGLQRHILGGLLDAVPAHPAAFGFVKERSCIEAAALHAGEEMVVSFDLVDFFGSVGGARIYGLFRALGYPHGVALMLRGFTTTTTPPWVLERLPAAMRTHLRIPHLPQGAPTSPALANLTAFRLDRRLAGLARGLGARYTRYADDLTFSGDQRIPRALLAAVPEILAEEGFRANSAKTRIMPRHTQQRVTGIVVNAGLNLPRKEYDRLKATLHACSYPGDKRLADPAFWAHLSGRVAWVETLNPAKGAKLRARFDALVGSQQTVLANP